MDEIWKDIPGYDGVYAVSSWGRVRRNDCYIDNGRGFLKHHAEQIKLPQFVPGSTYRYITLYKHNKGKSFNISDLVALMFLPNYDPNLAVFHKDQDILNDRVENLCQYVPPIQNPYIGWEDDSAPDEIWKPVPGAEKYYQISNYGRVLMLAKYVRGDSGSFSARHVRDKHVLRYCRIMNWSTPKHDDDYHMFVFHNPEDGTHQTYAVHRLVAELFIPNPDNLPYVNHIDANKLNNHVSNLEWCTGKQNAEHAARLGLLDWQVTNRSHTTPIVCITTGQEFKSIAEASRLMHIPYDHIQANLRHGSGVAGGKQFRYRDK